jgi:hypothetical protein
VPHRIAPAKTTLSTGSGFFSFVNFYEQLFYCLLPMPLRRFAVLKIVTTVSRRKKRLNALTAIFFLN